jgi:diadenosine tetraphosphatase ApaH/serine/threonine PP2A family protein phosphatase
MRTAIISDIHSNLEALKAVLDYIDHAEAEEIWCLGDIVGYGSSPNECVELVRERCGLVLKGNHDGGATGEVEINHFSTQGQTAIKWTQQQVTEKNLSFLRNLPLSAIQQDATLAHATPTKPESWRYILSWREARESFRGFTTPFCFIGHTHIPVVIREDGRIGPLKKGTRHLINVGSVGQPRDGNPKASFGLFDIKTFRYENVRVAYDVEKAAQAIKSAGLPPYLGNRLLLGV